MNDEACRTLVRGAAVTGHVRVEMEIPRGAGWLPYPDGVDELIDRAAQAVPGASRTVAAALLASSVAAAFAAPITGALLTERRVPIPRDVWLRPAFTGVDAIAIGAATMTALHSHTTLDDQGIDSRRYGVPRQESLDHGGPGGEGFVGSVAELRRVAVEGYRELLVPLVDLVSATTRRGRRALWADAGDRLATYLLLAGRASGDADAGRAEADALLALAEPPLRHEPAWLDFEHRGQRVVWKRRPVCCLLYQAPSFRGQYCATCPLVPVEETVTRTRAWLG